MDSSSFVTLCCRFFYASSACIYPEGRQLNTEVEGGGLREDDAWPAQVPCHTARSLFIHACQLQFVLC